MNSKGLSALGNNRQTAREFLRHKGRQDFHPDYGRAVYCSNGGGHCQTIRSADGLGRTVPVVSGGRSTR